ncbi:integrase core domain-containing protein [Thioalkalivibrio sp. ALJ2]|uniref:integrase core domain-containing protein n=1 Tax=Thioalkalivibrio sp. ALJ2 TaxID=1261622 RepID=UPI00350F8004
MELSVIQPDKPMQNGFIERFNGSYRHGGVHLCVSRTLSKARGHTEQWPQDCHETIPHESLANLTPVEYRSYTTPNVSLSVDSIRRRGQMRKVVRPVFRPRADIRSMPCRWTIGPLTADSPTRCHILEDAN